MLDDLKTNNMKKRLLLLAMGFAMTTQMIMAQVPSYVPTNGLAGWWGFSGNANDASTNANNGIVNGATLTADRFGNANSAYSFNGVNDNIYVNHVFDTPDKTVNVWFNATAITSFNRLIFSIDNKSLVNGANVIRVIKNGTSNYCGLTGASTVGTYIDRSVVEGQWYMVTMVKDTTITQFYLNGVLMGQINSGTYHSNDGFLTTVFGSNRNNFDWFNGLIDDIGIWNRALTQDEITNLYNANICYQNITVTDTLIINTGVLGFNPVTYNNTVTIYPNPANDHITIDCGNLANVNGWSIKIVNTLGQEVFSGAMNTQQYVVPLNTWGGQGIYFVKIYDSSNNLMNTKKIILN